MFSVEIKIKDEEYPAVRVSIDDSDRDVVLSIINKGLKDDFALVLSQMEAAQIRAALGAALEVSKL